MKRKYLILPFSLIIITGLAFFMNQQSDDLKKSEELRELHKQALENSPFKDTKNLTKEERKKLAIPPNGYNEMIWELTMDPGLGRPAPERLAMLQKQLNAESENQRGVGGDASNPWIDRGPNNIGGRTRGLMFDPNDGTNRKVFAGGVSGGLWVNNDITNANTSWTLVPGIGANISVNHIISDPNNSNTFYIGTGESYTSGAVIGRGIWKSTDGGTTWSNIWGGYTGLSSGNQVVDGVFYINDLVARDMGSTTELYAAVAGAYYGPSSPAQWHGLNGQNVYKSTDGGLNWTSLNVLESSIPINPNDIEIDPTNNDVWFTTTQNSFSGSLGGTIYRYDGTNPPVLVNSIANARRIEIEPSPTTANKWWIAAAELNSPSTFICNLYDTVDAFVNIVAITEPNDADPNIGAADFTRGQAWYDLVIESDASENLIAGGIDLFRKPSAQTTWNQISEWYNITGLTASYVHADIHSAVQRPGSPNSYIFGTDGGVFYTADITTAFNNSSAIQARNKDYNTIQFYYGAFSNAINGAAEDLVGGTQDNGTPAIYDASAGANAFTDITGGDGGYTDIDDNGNYIVTAYPGNTHYVVTPTQFYQIASGTGGNFINQAALDSNLDILYTNASTSVARIERISNFQSGAGSVVNTNLTHTDVLFNGSSPSAMKVSPYTTGSTKLFAGMVNGTLWRVDNADTTPTFNNITGGSFVGSISDIELGQTDQEIFVTMFNYGVTSIWYTANGGTTWVSKEGNLPDLPIRCVLQNPLIPQEVIIGTELGVWATADITAVSPSWVQTYNGMSDVTVVDLDVKSDNSILASTHGRGMFTSQFTSSPLSVDDPGFNETSISLVPTISDGNFELITRRALGEVQFELYDLSGKTVYNSNFRMNSNRHGFNLNLESGVYIVRIGSNGTAITKRIIIR
ncbi:MAG: T9SS type A sorting domain-containing protein [Flavobacteriaceae bacterium]|nr:T9SS type A sorting domain-containing protein [Flavobacteriaceae bacterium]